MTRPLMYLAVPYSSPDPSIRAARFEMANRAAGWLLSRGHVIFSPISHTHPIAEVCELPKGWEFWRVFDNAYLSVSDNVIVLAIDGWRESVGVQAEIVIAREMGIPVEYLVEHDGEFRFVGMVA